MLRAKKNLHLDDQLISVVLIKVKNTFRHLSSSAIFSFGGNVKSDLVTRIALTLAACTFTLSIGNTAANAQAVSYGTNNTCTVGQKVLAEPGDHPATVLATSTASCRVHYDDGAFSDSWVEIFNIKPGDINQKNAALAAAGPRIGRYNIAVGTGAYDGYLMIYSANSYELFLPSGTSAGKGTYTFNKATTSIRWNSGPLTNPQWDGTQKLDGNGKMLNIRIGKRSVATNTGP